LNPVTLPEEAASLMIAWRALPKCPPIVVPSADIEPVKRKLVSVLFAVDALDEIE
jgi:hypothetical protein